MDLEETEARNDYAGEGQQQFHQPTYQSLMEEICKDSQSRQTLKYGHESLGTGNQNLLCWREPAAI
jgi:hypothetical protein